jgi:hypothetical protein
MLALWRRSWLTKRKVGSRTNEALVAGNEALFQPGLLTRVVNARRADEGGPALKSRNCDLLVIETSERVLGYGEIPPDYSPQVGFGPGMIAPLAIPRVEQPPNDLPPV